MLSDPGRCWGGLRGWGVFSCVCVCVRSCVGVVGLVLCWLYVDKKYSKSSGARGIALTCRPSLAELRLSRPCAAEGLVRDEGRRCGLGFGGWVFCWIVVLK